MLTSLIRVSQPTDDTPEPEDIFSASLGLIFTDDIINQHGDPNTVIAYRSRFGELKFRTADPEDEEERRKFAHYLWNAGILVAEFIGGRVEHDKGANDVEGRYAEWERWKEGRWWLNDEEERKWNMKDETVLELGAGL